MGKQYRYKLIRGDTIEDCDSGGNIIGTMGKMK